MSSRLQISATFAAEPLKAVLEFWTSVFDSVSDVEVIVTDFNSVFRQLIDPTSEFRSQGVGGINFILFRVDDLFLKGGVAIAKPTKLPNCQGIIDDFLSALESYLQQKGRTRLFLVEARPSPSASALLTQSRSVLLAQLERLSSEHQHCLAFAPYEDMEAAMGCGFNTPAEYYDNLTDQLASIPYTENYYSLLGSFVFRKLMVENFSPAFKAFVMDCDNTIWGGILNEVGSDAIALDGEYARLREKLKKQELSGRLICLNSANDEKDVREAFQNRAQEILITESMITAWKVNWKPKHRNIQDLSTQLKLGMESFIFIDDDHTNIGTVRECLPQVLSAQFPSVSCSGEDQRNFVNGFWLLDQPRFVTSEDKNRNAMYQQNIKRAELETNSSDASFGDFLKKLLLKLSMEEVHEDNCLRVSQLTQRSNRFNASTIRMSEADVTKYISDENKRALCVAVEDKFGSYGISICIFLRWDKLEQTVFVENFVMSCRVLNRGVEFSALKLIAEHTQKLLGTAVIKLQLKYKKSAKNSLVGDFLDNLNKFFQEAKFQENDIIIPIASLMNASFDEYVSFLDTSVSVRKTSEPQKISKPAVPSFLEDSNPNLARNAVFTKIVQELYSLSKIDEAIKKHAIAVKKATIDNTSLQQILEVVEKQVSLLLGSITLSAEDLETPLFDLGLTSVSAVRLVAHLMRAFPKLEDGIPTTLIFDHPSVTKIAEFLQGELAHSNAVAETPVLEVDSVTVEQDDICVASMACKLPGGIGNPAELWEFLCQKKCARAEIQEDRWNVKECYPDDCGSEVTYLYPLENIRQFDNKLFRISDAEAKLMDPQQRLVLTVGLEALLRSNINAESPYNDIRRFQGANVGVFVALGHHDWMMLNVAQSEQKELETKSTYAFSGRLGSIASGRISFCLGLVGPSINVDTACSSSLAAVNTAIACMNNGDCDAALVVGINLNLHPETYVQLSRAKQLSHDGRCKAFDQSADGFARGEGCGAIVLQRNRDCSDPAKPPLAVVEAVGLNNDGRSASLPSPNGSAQRKCILQTLAKANIKPREISYVETHGAGTKLGDAIEFNSLKSVFGENHQLIVGAVKTNIGHLEAAAGMAGLIKTVLVLMHGKAPPNLHLEKISDSLNTSNFNVQFPKDLVELETNRAGVSSFGMSGTNAFALLRTAYKCQHDTSLSNIKNLVQIPEPIEPKEFGWDKPLPYNTLHNIPIQNVMVPKAYTETPSLSCVQEQQESNDVFQQVSKLIQSVAMNATEVSLLDTLKSLGIDSLSGIELGNMLLETFPNAKQTLPSPDALLYELPSVGDVVKVLSTTKLTGKQLPERPEETASVYKEVEKEVVKCLHSVSLTHKTELDLDASYSSLGIDSLAGIEFANALLAVYPLLQKSDKFSTAATLIYELETPAQTVRELVLLINLQNSSPEVLNLRGKTAILFTGQGAQEFGMARNLYMKNLVFRKQMLEINEVFKKVSGEKCLLDVIYGFSEANSKNTIDRNLINNTKYAQLSLFAVELSLWKLLEHRLKQNGFDDRAIRERFVFCGHSVGELVAVAASGAVSLEDAVKMVFARGSSISNCNSLDGAMVAVKASQEEVKQAISSIGPCLRNKISIAAVNGPEACVLSGNRKVIGNVLSKLTDLKHGYLATRGLVVSHAFHSPLILGAIEPFSEALKHIKFGSPTIPVLSTLSGNLLCDSDIAKTEHWVDHLSGTVNFYQSACNLLEGGIRDFIELGPAPTLLKLMGPIAQQCEIDFDRISLRCPLSKDKDDVESVGNFFTELSKHLNLIELEVSKEWQEEQIERKTVVQILPDSVPDVRKPVGKAKQPNMSIKNRKVQTKLKQLGAQLMNSDTLVERLEERLLQRILENWADPKLEEASEHEMESMTCSGSSKSRTNIRVSPPVSVSFNHPSPSSVTLKTFAEGPLQNSAGLVYLVDGRKEVLKSDLVSHVKSDFERLSTELKSRGSLLFRNCNLKTATDFRDVLELFQADGSTIRDYLDGISPRTLVIDGIYTSTEYSPALDMAVHNEMSYNPQPPTKIAFFCETPPVPGSGRTPLASSAQVLRKVPEKVAAEFRKKGLKYIVNSPSEGKGPGVSWQKMYQTDDRKRVEEVCNSLGIKTRWNADDSLTTFRVCSAIRSYRGEDKWFNHAHLFHPTDLPPRVQKALKAIHGESYDKYPKFCTYEDGSLISETYLEQIRQAQKECMISFDWQQGDLLVIDNMMLCHGRQAFDVGATPKRKILASMLF